VKGKYLFVVVAAAANYLRSLQKVSYIPVNGTLMHE
jgi:hypothetical protein